MDLQTKLIFDAPMMKPMACVMLSAVLFACGNKEAQPEATSPTPTTSAPVAASASASAAASTTPVTSASAASSATPAADEGVVIQVKGNVIMVNGSPADSLGTRLDDLSAKLKSTRELWMKLHAGQTFPGRATVKAEKSAPAAGIAHILDVARAAGYPNVAVANP